VAKRGGYRQPDTLAPTSPRMMCSSGQLSVFHRRSEDPNVRGGENTGLAMLFEQIQDSRVKSERPAGGDGFHLAFKLLDYRALKSQLYVNPAYVLPL
jgi:hypothetical protein